MKKKHTAQSAPARRPAREAFRSSLGEGGFLNVCISVGVLVFFAGLLLALSAASAPGRTDRGEAKPPALIPPPNRVIGTDGAAGENCQYIVTCCTDTIVPGTTDIGNHCVDCSTLVNLPFPFTLYNQTFTTVRVSPNGRLDFVCDNEPDQHTESCLPASPHNCPYDFTIFALWHSWATLSNLPACSTWANGCGIFISISGTAPNRVFNIEWHVLRNDNNVQPANFEVRLYENDMNKRFDVIYGAVTGVSYADAAGVQGPSGLFTQLFCNVLPPQNSCRTYIMPPCDGPTPTATPTTIVTNNNDSGPGSLRQALADANDGDTITFAVCGAINLTSGDLLVNKSVTIAGPGAASLAVDSNHNSRIFHIGSGKTVSISGLAITNGSVMYENGGGVLNDHAVLTMDGCALQGCYSQRNQGGAIYNDGSAGGATLTILNSTVSSNGAYLAGGGIYNDAHNDGTATLSVSNCIINSNIAGHADNPIGSGDGGGIYNNGGTLTITESVVSNNQVGAPDPFPVGTGGGIASSGALTITNSTIVGNQAYFAGGGIAGAGVITNSTISGNGATGQHDGQPWGRGGGIFGGVTLTNSTLSGNYANLAGGGIAGGGTITNSTLSDNNGGGISVSGALDIGNSVLKAGASGANISNNGGTVTSHGYNVCSDAGGGFLNGSGDQVNTDPLLGPLQSNGGPTFTHELLNGSPAIDAGDPKFTPPPYYDQRGPGFSRVRNDRIDVGSFEVQAGTAPTPTPTSTATPTPTATASATATATPTASLSPSPTSTARPSPTPRPALTPRPRPSPPPRP